MKVDHGVIIVATDSDWLFAKGCIASIRYFMPNIPVTLLVDGSIDTTDAERYFRVGVIRRQDIKDKWLRNSSFGWGITKMNSFWFSPYEHFAHLDADTVVWGNLCSKFFAGNTDVLWSAPFNAPLDPASLEKYIDTWFFDTRSILLAAPDFDWRSSARKFSCTGTFVARRNCLSIKRYKELMEIAAKFPGLFKFGEMGILNLMIFESLDRGELTLRTDDFQIVFPDHDQINLRQRFSIYNGAPHVDRRDIGVLHMTDAKPLISNKECYSEPMTFFRLEYLSTTRGLQGEAALAVLTSEDGTYHKRRQARLRRERARKIAGLLQGDIGQWRRVGTKLGLLS